MKTEVKNPLNGVVETLNFPCSESRISDACYELEIENNYNGKVEIVCVEHNKLSSIVGSQCNLDELNLFCKQLYHSCTEEQDEVFEIAEKYKFNNIKDLINLVYNPQYFIEDDHQIYKGKTLPPSFYDEPEFVVELINTKTNESDFLYLPCEDYVIDKCKARIDCFEDKEIEVYIETSLFNGKTIEIMLEDYSLENLNDLAEYCADFNSKDYRILNQLVEKLELEDVGEIVILAREYRNFEINDEITDAIEYGENIAHENGLYCDLPEIIEHINFEEFGEQMIADNKAFFIDSGCVEYAGDDSYTKSRINKLFDDSMEIKM